MIEFMKKTRDRYYTERKKLYFRYTLYNWIRKPILRYIIRDKRFDATYKEQKILKSEGRIAIGAIVQANSALFKKGRINLPAAMIFSEDPYFEENPDKLRYIASSMYALKGNSSGDEELQRFSDILEDQVVTLFNVEVPQKITYGKKVFFTTFMVHREYLPNKYIDFECFPALVFPGKTEASIILPSRYWGI